MFKLVVNEGNIVSWEMVTSNKELAELNFRSAKRHYSVKGATKIVTLYHDGIPVKVSAKKNAK